MVLFGLIWVTYVMREQFLDWSENPTILTKSKLKLSDMDFPALTICSEGSTKFAIAEELGNSFAPNKLFNAAISFHFAYLGYIKKSTLTFLLQSTETRTNAYLHFFKTFTDVIFGKKKPPLSCHNKLDA